MTKLIILRPSSGAEQSAIIARDMGFDPIIASATKIISLPWSAPLADAFDAIMITSANALRHSGRQIEQYRHLPLFAVGKATAKLAQNMGFNIAAIGHGGAKALRPHITKYGAKKILRIVGRDHIAIQSDGIQITTVQSYEACPLPIPKILEKLFLNNEAPLIFTFHSARAVQIFDSYIETMAHHDLYFDKSKHYAAFLAPGIAKAMKSYPHSKWKRYSISPSAEDHVMLKSISEMLGV